MNKRMTTKQANFRLPAELVEELRETSERTPYSQTDIVKKGIERRLKEIKAQKTLQVEVAVNG